MDSHEVVEEEEENRTLKEGAVLAIPPLRASEKFHLFVSYSSLDAAWTHELIHRLEAEQTGLRVCFHERDFLPGRNIIENMVECIQQSQKMLLVLSQDFVQSRWCLLEANLSLFRHCMERKPVIPVLLRPCRIPLHLNHLTYLEADDSCFYTKVVRALCMPNHLLQHSTLAPVQLPSLYSGKMLMTLSCVNKDSLPSWRVGTFSTLSVPDPLRVVLDDPEVYRKAIGMVNRVLSPRSCLRYLGCRVTLGTFLILLSIASLFLPFIFGLEENSNPRGYRFLLVAANVFFCPLFLVSGVGVLCWFRRFFRRKMQELSLCVGEANTLLASHSVLMGCETLNKLCFTYVLLEDCRQAFLEASTGPSPRAEAVFYEALRQFSSDYACCLANAHFPPWEDVGSRGHLDHGLCFCQYVSLQLRRHRWLGPAPYDEGAA
ncbi:uncharacterized protein LOC126059179 [Elephas maximus indicus]|uniref:uncharacterized protein LOC126059179 n=1 Tax=Elephas maximus indicus TaxID=99487 RepID=UPI002116E2CA|nr:uncharacterized protein LOC126059179 [Elephas maximus indicus]XP_049710673.1 uncharacterized protein LOC126059179 [Elephas maximus indicus]